MTPWVRGDLLPPSQQAVALRHFHRRFTRDHRPQWVREMNRMGEYPKAEISDREWLARVWVRRTADGKVDLRCRKWREAR